jgi:hypothetical protein
MRGSACAVWAVVSLLSLLTHSAAAQSWVKAAGDVRQDESYGVAAGKTPSPFFPV